MRLATRLMLSASATDDPPYFWTISAMSETPGVCRRADRAARARDAAPSGPFYSAAHDDDGMRP
jgi:hypothetical protein